MTIIIQVRHRSWANYNEILHEMQNGSNQFRTSVAGNLNQFRCFIGEAMRRTVINLAHSPHRERQVRTKTQINQFELKQPSACYTHTTFPWCIYFPIPRKCDLLRKCLWKVLLNFCFAFHKTFSNAFVFHKHQINKFYSRIREIISYLREISSILINLLTKLDYF